ncbi:MAG: response regulator [bacterium]
MVGAFLKMTESAKRRAWKGAFLFILFFTSFLLVWVICRTNTLLHADLLRRAWLMAQAVNVNRVYGLTGSNSDLDKPQYLRLKKQLVDVMHLHKDIEKIYILCRHPSGEFFCVLDSTPLEITNKQTNEFDSGHTSMTIQQVLADQRIYVDGFVTQYIRGKISVFVPINEPKTGKMLAVLGMDMCTSQWSSRLAYACLPSVLLFLILTAILVMGKRLVHWRTSKGANAYAWMSFIEPGLVFTIGVVLTGFSVLGINERGNGDYAEKFSQLSTKRTAKIAQKLTTLRDFEIEGFSKFFECSKYVSDAEFAGYAEHLTQDIVVDSWSWIVAVTDKDKERFERETIEIKGSDFMIWEPGGRDKRVQVLGRDIYFPIYQLAPLQGNESRIGYDFGENQKCRSALELAAQSKLPTATDTIEFVHRDKRAKNIYVYKAVFEKGSAQKVIGYVAVQVNFDALLTPVDPGTETLVNISMVHGDGTIEAIAETQKNATPVDPSLSHMRPLFAFGKTFSISAMATNRFLPIFPIYAGWWTALVGLLLTASVCCLQILVMQRRRELQMLVDERTYSLRISEDHLAATLRSIDDGVITCDVHGRITSLNGVAEMLTGWKTPDAHGRYVKEVFRIVDAKTGCPIPSLVDRVLKEGRGGDLKGDTLLISRTLYEYPIASSCELVREEGGAVIGAVLVFRDETVHKREEMMVLSSERLEAMLELERMTGASIKEITDFALEKSVILTHSKIGYLAFLNDAEDELTMYSWSKSTMEECKIEDKSFVYQVAETGLWGESIRQRKSIITNNYAAASPWKKGMPVGHVNLTRHISVPIFFDGKIVLLVGSGNKETDYTEDDINQLSLFMHGLWNILKRKHTENALKAAKEEAERAMRVKSEFLANMSHEIRTPINAVIGMSELLKRTELSQKQQKYIQRMDSSSRLLLQIINDILDLSKIEAGRLKFDLQQFVLSELLDTLESMFSVAVAEKKIDLFFNISPDVPNILVSDSLRLSQVLTNLLSNAIKFTEKGYVELNILLVRCPTLEEPRNRIRFEVVDTGIGLSEEQVKNLFRPFTQADPSTTRKYGGTGLGLVISNKLVEYMGGRIAVDSTRGKGSTFYFELELESKNNEQVLLSGDKSCLAKVGNDKQVYPDFKKYTVLVVEDNIVNQEVIVGLLEVTGVELVVAENGRLALEKMSAQSFDLILMDLQMPEMDGFEAIQRIRDSGNNVPIVALSAAVMDSDRMKATRAGANDYLTKPIDFKALLMIMERLLNYSKSEHNLSSLSLETLEQSAPLIFDEIEGFDVKKGLEQVNNMQELYSDVLVSFLDELKGLFADLPTRLSREITDDTRRKIHTLKGVAATVGAIHVTRMATVINSMLKSNHAITAELIAGLSEALMEAKNSLESFVRRKDDRK